MPSSQLNTASFQFSAEIKHPDPISMDESTCHQILGNDSLQFLSNAMLPPAKTNDAENDSSQNKQGFTESESLPCTSEDSNVIKHFFLSVQLLTQIEKNQKTIDSLFEMQTKIKQAKQYLCSMGITMD